VYDQFVDETCLTPEGELAIHFHILALCEEVGEAAGKCKRLFRGDYYKKDEDHTIGLLKFEDDVAQELGDALWYLTAAAHTLGLTLEEIADLNMKKLSRRKEEGKLRGSGDNR
jgi:NTP pyrophosphatase (non-canonical NTP hydrolase)